jgi:hypothetical protein
MEPTNLGSKLFGGSHGVILRGKEGHITAFTLP